MTRLLHLSDPHFGAADQKVAAAFLRQAKDLAPDFTILSGDLTMRARRDELTAAKAFVDALPQPRLLIPGNHDIPSLNQPFDRFFNPFSRYRKYFGKETEPEWIDDSLHVVSLNSTRAFGLHADWSEGILTTKQLHEMVASFQGGPAKRCRVLVLHHPLLAPKDRLRSVVRPLPDLIAAIDTARVDLVLCGHFHRSQLATAGKLGSWTCVVSQASTVCSTRLQGEPQGFHEIRILPRHLEIIPYAFSYSAFVAGTAVAFSKETSGWKDGASAPIDELLIP